MSAYYNEIDPFAAQWLRELIHCGIIAPGDVDERDIKEVISSDLKSYTQCHFFAGIGVWSYALRQAGWDDRTPVWTGSCPCQPFSQAGKGRGFADSRHLWPVWYKLISECKPDRVLGEQVASSNGHTWFDLVSADMERASYAIGAVNLPACGVGAPHIRQRLWFVGESVANTLPTGRTPRRTQPGYRPTTRSSCTNGVAYSESKRPERNVPEERQPPSHSSIILGDPGEPRSGGNSGAISSEETESQGQWLESGNLIDIVIPPGPVNGFWESVQWIPCRDGKARPIEPGTFPLVHGTPARMGRLRGYGNAINAQAAKAFIKAYMDVSVA